MVRFIAKSVCSKNVVEDFWYVDFFCAMVEGMVLDSNMNDFSSSSGKLFAILIFYLEVGNVGK